MGMSFGYVTRETATNLRRNWLMTIAAVLTIMVSLALVGITFLLWRGVDQFTVNWKKNVEVSVFMKTDAKPEEFAAMRKKLDGLPTVKRYFYVNEAQTYKEFRTWTANARKAYEDIKPGDLPTSFRIVPKKVEYVDSIGQQVEHEPGVYSVAFAKTLIDKVRKISSALQVGMALAAGVLVICAMLLILNTIQIAIYNRRREVAVMKLVGATNWFIRVPFMVEGMVQGLMGALAAVAVVALAWSKLRNNAAHSTVDLYRLVPVGHQVMLSSLLILAIGTGLGILGSAFAIRRYLKV